MCDANIAVVLNVKSKILKRVSRFFSTPIVESLGSMVERPVLGACERYHSEMYNMSEGEPKNLVRKHNEVDVQKLDLFGFRTL